jgi:hypothetical protein
MRIQGFDIGYGTDITATAYINNGHLSYYTIEEWDIVYKAKKAPQLLNEKYRSAIKYT